MLRDMSGPCALRGASTMRAHVSMHRLRPTIGHLPNVSCRCIIPLPGVYIRNTMHLHILIGKVPNVMYSSSMVQHTLEFVGKLAPDRIHTST